MAGYVRTSRHPLPSVTNHGLIKLLILRSLAQQNWTWAQFLAGAGIIREHALEMGGIEVEEEDRGSSNSVGGDDEMLEEWDQCSGVTCCGNKFRGNNSNIRSCNSSS